MADEMNTTSWGLGDYKNSTFLSEDQLEKIIYSYIGIAIGVTLIIALFNRQIGKFYFFNSSLPFLDILTDGKAVILYWFYEDHPYWAAMTLLWVVLPFSIHLGKFVFRLCTCEATCDDLKDVVFHIPFVRPLRNAYLAIKLSKLGYGGENTDWAAVEEIQREVAKAGLTENYFESGPQSVQQLVISFSTGRFSPSVIIGIVVSIFSLAWGASRAYFLERTEDETDPDPALAMVALSIFPLKLVVLCNSLLMYVLMAGMGGPVVLAILPLVFFANLCSIVKYAKKMYKDEEGESGESKEKKNFFRLKASLASLWLPSVIGNRKNMLLVSSVSTLVTKLASLLAILILAICGLLQEVHMHPFTIWCEYEWVERAQTGLTLCSFDDKNSSNLTSCFGGSDSKQKLRVCSPGTFERDFITGLLVVVIVTNCASLAASLRLNRLSNYVQLFLATKSIHRSAIFALVNSNKKEDNEVFEEMMLKGGIKDVVNRRNHAGDSALRRACATGDSWKVFLLWNAGAEPLEGRKPELEEHLKKYAILGINGEPLRTEISGRPGIQHVVERHTAEMEPLFQAWMTSTAQDQGVAEANMLDLFERFNVNIMSVPTELDGTNKSSIEEAVKKIRQWNSAHAQKCE